LNKAILSIINIFIHKGVVYVASVWVLVGLLKREGLDFT
jgi:hypothetical protein